MPMVGKKKFPYTAKGEKDAKMEEKKTGKKMVKRVAKKATKKKTSMIRKKGM
jgi:hypothetical protein